MSDPAASGEGASGVPPPAQEVARLAVSELRDAGATVAAAESLTGGLLTAAVVDVPGASEVLRGGVVAYATDVKSDWLGVDAGLLEDRGAVDAEVAVQMACGVRTRLRATYGMAVTGVAGPGPAEGKAPGTVHVAVAGPRSVREQVLALTGSREQIRRASVMAALVLLRRSLAADGAEERDRPDR